MANIFLISDTHFGHKNIIKFKDDSGNLIRSGFRGIHDMNEKLIERWNSVVKKNDRVYHLGDFCLGSKSNIAIADRLNGKKFLVMGNHEHNKAIDYLEYFDDVMGCKILDRHILTHIPVHISQSHRFKANIHGHLHDRKLDDKFYINVSCEQINYTPIPFEKIRVK